MRKFAILFFMILATNMLAKDSYKIFTQDKNIISKKLENGFSYIIKKNKKPSNYASIRLLVHVGSLEESDTQKGLAHLIEHLAFNGTKHFPNNELVEFLESLGVAFGSHLNASTGTNRTLYRLDLPLKNDNLQKAMQVMSDWASGINFTQKELDKEKGVVLEEARARYDLRYRLYLQRKDLLYANSKYKDRMPIGDMDIIKNISLDEVKSFYDKWYRPELISLIVVGDFNVSEVQKLVETSFEHLKNRDHEKIVSRKVPFDETTKVAFLQDKEVTSSLIDITFVKEAIRINSKEELRQSLIDKFLVKLFNQKASEQMIKKNPISKGIRLRPSRIGSNLEHYVFYGIRNNKEYLKALDELVRLIYLIEKYGFDKQNFVKVKDEFIKQNRQNLKSVNDKSSSSYANIFVKKILDHEVITSEEFKNNLEHKLLNQISLHDVNSAYKNLLKSKNQIITFTISDEHNFTKEQVLHRFNSAKQNINIDKNIKKLPSLLVSEKLKPSKIIKEFYDKEFNFYEFTLENGIKVIYKFNDYDKNLVLLSGFSKGGFNDYKHEDLINAKFSTDIISRSGFDKYNILEVEKIYYDKMLSLNPFLSKYQKGFRGKSVSSDFKFLLEMIYLFSKKYRFDENIFSNTLSSLKTAIKNEDKNPKLKFEKEFLKFYYKDDKRYTKTTLKDLQKIDKSGVLDIYAKNFGDLNDFTFIIVGDIKKEDVLKYSSLYLGNLDAKKSLKTIKDDGFRPLENEQNFIRNYSNVNISNTFLKYSKETPYSLENSILLLSLSNVLKTKIREIIREEKSGTYSSSVYGRYQILPFSNASITINFTSDPKRAKELTYEIKKIIKSLKDKEVDIKYTKNFIKQRIVGLKTAYKRAKFWQGQLYGHYFYNKDLITLDGYKKMYKSITPKDIKKAANLFLDTKNILTTRLNPKNFHE